MITLTQKNARALLAHILDQMTPEERKKITTPGIAITPKCHPGRVAVFLEQTPENEIEVRLECLVCDESPVRLILGDDPRYDDQALPHLENLETLENLDPPNDKIH
jgi:hypothetical protein